MKMQNEIKESISQIRSYVEKMDQCSEIIEKIAEEIIKALENGNKIIFCGNGGSAAISQHLSAELMGKYKLNRSPMAAISLTTDTSAITAIANDYGFEYTFSRQLLGIGKSGDVIIGISGSGNSSNLVEVLKTAKEMDIKTVAFLGEFGGKMADFAEISLKVPSSTTNYIQELHLIAGHIICGLVENYFWGKYSTNKKVT